MLPLKMKAAILNQLGEELKVDEVLLPEKLDFGQVLVRVFYTTICGSQIGEIDGVKGKDNYLPHLLGHEGSGVVIETGPGVQTVKAGDHVVMHWRKGEGIEAQPPSYLWKEKPLNAGYVTTFNEYAVVAENRLTTIPEDFDLKIAPLFGCAVTTGFGVIANNARLKIGESIVVFGAGGIGLSIIQGAALTSAYPIIAVDLYDNKLKLAKQFGATHLINSTDKDAKAGIQTILGSHGADVVIDNTGIADIIALAYQTTQSQGRTILVGVPKAGDNISIYSLPLHFGKTLTGSHGGEAMPHVDIPNYIRLFQAGKLNVENMITATLGLDNINEGIEMMRTGKIAGRCLIDMA